MLRDFLLHIVRIIFLDQVAAVLPVELAVGPAAQVVEAAGGEFTVGLVALVGNIQGLDDGEQELVLFFGGGGGVGGCHRLRPVVPRIEYLVGDLELEEPLGYVLFQLELEPADGCCVGWQKLAKQSRHHIVQDGVDGY